MKIRFNIDYQTFWGQRLMVTGSTKELGAWDTSKAIQLEFLAGERWSKEISFTKESPKFEYKFFLLDEHTGGIEYEFGDNRTFDWKGENGLTVDLVATWRSSRHDGNSLFTSPFTKGLVKPVKKKKVAQTNNFQFKLRAIDIPKGFSLKVSGAPASLGSWNVDKAVSLERSDLSQWHTTVQVVERELPFEYKYLLFNDKTGEVRWEIRENRTVSAKMTSAKEYTIVADEYARFPFNDWRGTGLAIPVFSIRTRQSTGVGEFEDIQLVVDWATKTGIKLIQILPVNDTVATHTWVDSYPYAAISVFASHPMYLNIWSAGQLKDKKKEKYFREQQKELNQLEEVDYERVMQVKDQYMRDLYKQQGAQLIASDEFEKFYKDNIHWLPAYAMFCELRDRYNTSNFQEWPEYNQISPGEIEKYTSPKSASFSKVGYYYFLQFHLDKQLKAATAYARKKGVVLKGDIPIGIYRNSVDAWTNPELYHMGGQAGAPPDDFSISGQNWGFPTYNWEKMSQDDYHWWRLRLQKMADYFDVFRIDHILGFFRIWEIPIDAVEGLLGYFNPSMPYSIDDLRNNGIHFDYERLCKPFIKEYMVHEIFHGDAEYVKSNYLEHAYNDVFRLKPEFDTQRKVKSYFDCLNKKDPSKRAHHDFLKFGLFQLQSEVIFIEAPESNGQAFNPRISFHSTYSYRELDHYTQQRLNELYTDYYYRRHNQFWQDKAMQKLPALKSATDMLICGEDLGMVPDCVPGVMDELKILSLVIQRMPNDSSKEFWHPSDTPYLSVCSTSSHDMSTLRGWWEEDREKTRRFYHDILGMKGEPPFFCEPWIAKAIVDQHLYSPSMWAIFPVQDLLAMDIDLRRKSPEKERINVPANPQHYWRYRLHLNIEDLLDQKEFNDTLKEMITKAGRNFEY